MPRISLLCLCLLAGPFLSTGRNAVLVPALGAIDYTIQIENTMGHEMDFFYSDTDSTEQVLGTIPPYLAQKFVIKSPARTSIVIIERGSAMGDYEMRKTIELVADSVVAVAF
jgi:hypothetical protein